MKMAYSKHCSGFYAESLLPPGTYGFPGGRSSSERVYFTAFQSVRLKGRKRKLIGKFDLSNQQNGFFVGKRDYLRIYIDINKNGRLDQKRDALIGIFNRLADDTTMKHSLQGNPAPSELRQGLSRMVFGEESYIKITRKKEFKIGRGFFKKGRRERIDVHVDMEKNKDDAYFYKWGDRFDARTDYWNMDDGSPYSTGYYIVGGGGYECI